MENSHRSAGRVASKAKPLPYAASKKPPKTQASETIAKTATKQSALANALRTPSKLRPIILTALVGGITATGVWYGASQKWEDDVNEERRKLRVVEPEERIKNLQEQRQRWVVAKDELDKKIQDLQARQAQAAMKGAPE